uniref:Kinetochore protein Spc24 n=1 Tax=Geotrypetes seraphini TaxID=260995 RepID=A0A6P8NRI7_GEOSA|nr:kinetochore protein Spc24 [Geotrypetes seraphini]
MATISENLQTIEDISKDIVQILSTLELPLEKTLAKEEQILDLLLETEVTASDIIKDFLALEKNVAEKLIEVEGKKQNSLATLCQIEEELKAISAENVNVKTDLQFLMKELEKLKEMEEEMEQMQQEVDEDTTIATPSAVYRAQLYHLVTKIQWDYDCDPTLIKGVHYNGDVAQPINIDSTQHSKTFICDYLWSLVSTDW